MVQTETFRQIQVHLLQVAMGVMVAPVARVCRELKMEMPEVLVEPVEEHGREMVHNQVLLEQMELPEQQELLELVLRPDCQVKRD